MQCLQDILSQGWARLFRPHAPGALGMSQKHCATMAGEARSHQISLPKCTIFSMLCRKGPASTMYIPLRDYSLGNMLPRQISLIFSESGGLWYKSSAGNILSLSHMHMVSGMWTDTICCMIEISLFLSTKLTHNTLWCYASKGAVSKN